MYTQSAAFDGQLMVLMVMLCSSLVINVRSNLTETDLDRLACFCRMAKMIAGEKSTVRYSCTANCSCANVCHTVAYAS